MVCPFWLKLRDFVSLRFDSGTLFSFLLKGCCPLIRVILTFCNMFFDLNVPYSPDDSDVSHTLNFLAERKSFYPTPAQDRCSTT